MIRETGQTQALPAVMWTPRFSRKAVVVEEDCIGQLIARFSCLRKMKIAVAWLRRFIVFLCRRRMPNLELKKQPISIEELTATEIAVVRYVQRQNFGRWMIASTGRGQPLKLRNESSPAMKLDPILVDNVLRVGGRLDKAPLSYEARHPAILPHISHLTELVIRYFHERVAHFDVNHTLNAICQRYWTVKAVVAVRRMISKCVSCRRRNSFPTNFGEDFRRSTCAPSCNGKSGIDSRGTSRPMTSILSWITVLYDPSGPLGRVLEAYPNEHGVVRSVLVRLKGREIKRPIHKLCLIQPCDENESANGRR